jgi:hypothetical protein
MLIPRDARLSQERDSQRQSAKTFQLDSPTEMSWHFASAYCAVHVMCDPQ